MDKSKKLNKIHLRKVYKFMLVFLLLIIYTFFMIKKYGITDGPLVSLTTWSFFVFCTPIADAGFLIDFPIRLLTGFKMIYSEILVWVVAGLITAYSFIFVPQIYEVSLILNLYYHILSNLFPYGIIILLSAVGTFFSIHFGEELLDTSISGLKREKYNRHKNKHRFIILLFLIILIIGFYYYLLEVFNIDIPLF